jgi:hypothetical protein
MLEESSVKIRDELLRAAKTNPLGFFESFCKALDQKRKCTFNAMLKAVKSSSYKVYNVHKAAMFANFYNYTAVFEELAKNENFNLTSSQKNEIASLRLGHEKHNILSLILCEAAGLFPLLKKCLGDETIKELIKAPIQIPKDSRDPQDPGAHWDALALAAKHCPRHLEVLLNLAGKNALVKACAQAKAEERWATDRIEGWWFIPATYSFERLFRELCEDAFSEFHKENQASKICAKLLTEMTKSKDFDQALKNEKITNEIKKHCARKGKARLLFYTLQEVPDFFDTLRILLGDEALKEFIELPKFPSEVLDRDLNALHIAAKHCPQYLGILKELVGEEKFGLLCSKKGIGFLTPLGETANFTGDEKTKKQARLMLAKANPIVFFKVFVRVLAGDCTKEIEIYGELLAELVNDSGFNLAPQQKNKIAARSIDGFDRPSILNLILWKSPGSFFNLRSCLGDEAVKSLISRGKKTAAVVAEYCPQYLGVLKELVGEEEFGSLCSHKGGWPLTPLEKVSCFTGDEKTKKQARLMLAKANPVVVFEVFKEAIDDEDEKGVKIYSALIDALIAESSALKLSDSQKKALQEITCGESRKFEKKRHAFIEKTTDKDQFIEQLIHQALANPNFYLTDNDRKLAIKWKGDISKKINEKAYPRSDFFKRIPANEKTEETDEQSVYEKIVAKSTTIGDIVGQPNRSALFSEKQKEEFKKSRLEAIGREINYGCNL